MAEEIIYKFERPPVNETVLGVQFDPLPRLSSAHLGAFWASLGTDWPVVNDAPELEQQFERFGKGEQWKSWESDFGFHSRLSFACKLVAQTANA